MPFKAAELRSKALKRGSRAAKQRFNAAELRFNVLRTFNAPAVRFKRHDVPFKVQSSGAAGKGTESKV